MLGGLNEEALTTTLVIESVEGVHFEFVTVKVNEVAELFVQVVGVCENPAMLSAVNVAENGRFCE